MAKMNFARPRERGRVPLKNIPNKAIALKADHNGKSWGGASLAVGALVLIVKVIDPFPVTLGGLKLHVLSLGKPEQVGVTVPVKPFCALIVSVPTPENPGFWMVMIFGVMPMTKSD